MSLPALTAKWATASYTKRSVVLVSPSPTMSTPASRAWFCITHRPPLKSTMTLSRRLLRIPSTVWTTTSHRAQTAESRGLDIWREKLTFFHLDSVSCKILFQGSRCLEGKIDIFLPWFIVGMEYFCWHKILLTHSSLSVPIVSKFRS